jgi:putative transposase
VIVFGSFPGVQPHAHLFRRLTQLAVGLVPFLEQAFLHLTQLSHHSIVLSTTSDLTRSKGDLVAENALLRQELVVLHRQVKKPSFSQSDWLWLVLLASRVKNWKDTLCIFKPDTLLSWHRRDLRLFWMFKSRNRGGRPKLPTETVALIQRMAQENRLWGAERIRGELLKLVSPSPTTQFRNISLESALPNPRRRPGRPS